MKALHLRIEPRLVAAVVDDVVGGLQPLLPAGLGPHDRLDLLADKPRALHHACHLHLLRAVHHQHPLDAIAARCPTPPAAESPAAHSPRRLRAAAATSSCDGAPDHRVQDRFQRLACLGVRKYMRAHRRAIEAAVGGDHRRRRSARGSLRCAAPPGAVSRCAMTSVSTSAAPRRDEPVRDRALAAADAAGQADRERCPLHS